MAKYESQVVFSRIHHIAESMRHTQELWNDMVELCQYRVGTHRAMVVDPDKFDQCLCGRDPNPYNEVYCHWSHCTVDKKK